MSSPVNLARFLQELLESTRITSIECRCYAVIHLPSHENFITIIESLHTTTLIEPVINNVDELNEDECFDPGGGAINFEVDNSFKFVTWIFLPYLTYPDVSPLLLSTKSEDTIFDPDIST
ncbi:hypothetical protein Tco_0850268 [Tanacetum coccineum]